MNNQASFKDSKPHYELLDGLRGVAALLVVWYHINEGFGFSSAMCGVGDGLVRIFNHGYLAVDFFFILSGFVIGYAYDDRWKKGFKLGSFFKRRLIRLHPMVVMGAVIGAVSFLIGGSLQWDGTHIATSAVMLSLLCAMFMIPAAPGCPYEVRGNGEMFPLNGPAWSLFFEYIGNILYALFIRKLPTKVLAALTAVLAVALGWFAMTDVSGYGSIGVGWTLDKVNFFGGMLRMLFPYSMGMLLSRVFKPVKVRGTFWISSLAMVLLFSVPYIPSSGAFCWNGLFETFCIALVFPSLVWLGASGSAAARARGVAVSYAGFARTAGDEVAAGFVCQTGPADLAGSTSAAGSEDAVSAGTKFVNFLGDLSFPLYMVHYPVMYLFYAWMIRVEKYTFSETWPVATGTMLLCILIAWLCLKLYDAPLRKVLGRRF